MKILNKRNIQYLQLDKMIYIGRPVYKSNEHFGNPFSVIRTAMDTIHVNSREEAIDHFEKWIRGLDYKDVEPKRRKWILEHLFLLRGKHLVCWCAPKPCHGDIYIQLLREIK